MKLTYAGDQTAFDADTYIGTNNRFFRPVDASYDSDADRTTITYAPVPLDEMSTRYAHYIESAMDRVQIAGLCGGVL